MSRAGPLFWAAIAAAVVVAFLPALGAGFVSWDDYDNFVLNRDFRGLGWSQLRWAWTTTLLGHYVPLSWMSLELDYVLWGLSPRGFHLTNILLHAANAVLVGLVALRLMARAPGPPPRLTRFVAGLAALLFALHPLRVESVAWVTERRDVLSLCFVLLATLAYLRFARGEGGRRAYVASLVLFAAALLSKASTVSVPAALLILNVYPLRRIPAQGGVSGESGARASDWWSAPSRRVYLELVPFFVMSALAAVGSMIALQEGAQLPVGGKIAVSAYSLVFYLMKTVLPVGLAPLYQMPVVVRPGAAMYVGCYLAVGALIATLWLVRRRYPAVTAALAVFAALVLPMLGIVQNGPQIAADRYTYLAAAPLAMLGALAIARLPRNAAYALAAVIVLALGALTWRQTGFWKDSDAVWNRILQVDSTSHFAQNNVGVAAAERGNTAEAIRRYERAIALDPGYAEPHNNLGYELMQANRLDEAIAEFRRAIALEPDFPDAEVNLGTAFAMQGKYDDAIAHFTQAATLAPSMAGAHFNWALALVRANRLPEARERLARVLELDSQMPEARALYDEVTARLQRVPR